MINRRWGVVSDWIGHRGHLMSLINVMWWKKGDLTKNIVRFVIGIFGNVIYRIRKIGAGVMDSDGIGWQR